MHVSKYEISRIRASYQWCKKHSWSADFEAGKRRSKSPKEVKDLLQAQGVPLRRVQTVGILSIPHQVKCGPTCIVTEVLNQ